MAIGPFDLAYGWLIDAFDRYRSVPRSPESVHELAAARADLEDARANAAIARGPIRADAPTPDLVDSQPIGSTARSAQLLAGASALAALGAIAVVMWAISLIGQTLMIEDSVNDVLVEEPDATCDWLNEDFSPSGSGRMALIISLSACPDRIDEVVHGSLRILDENGATSTFSEIRSP